MTDGFRIVDLNGHIREVDEQVVEPMQRASEAGRPLDVAAYGVVGRGFGIAAGIAVDVGAFAVARLADDAQGIAERLRRTRDEYLRIEEEVQAVLTVPSATDLANSPFRRAERS